MIKIVLKGGFTPMTKPLTLADLESFNTLARSAGGRDGTELQVTDEGIVFQTVPAPEPEVSWAQHQRKELGDEPPF